MTWLLVSASVWAACESPIEASALSGELDEAERLYPEGTPAAVAAFLASTGRIRSALPCLSSVVLPAQAARVHRVLGLEAWLRRSEGGLPAAVYFAAARSVEPFYSFPDTLLRPTDPELRQYGILPADTGVRAPLATQPGRQPHIDGDPSYNVAISWPGLVQWTDATDAVVCSEYHLPGTPFACVAPPPSDAPPDRPPTASIVVTGLSGAVLAGGVGWQVWQSQHGDELGAGQSQRSQVGAAALLVAGGLGVIGGSISLLVHEESAMIVLGRPW